VQAERQTIPFISGWADRLIRRRETIEDINSHARRLLGSKPSGNFVADLEYAPRCVGRYDVQLEIGFRTIRIVIDGSEFEAKLSYYKNMVRLERTPLARAINAIVGGNVRQVFKASDYDVQFVESILSIAKPK
jgi:hypothetical protein